MTTSVGFRVGLLLEEFFADLRKRCYFFVDTTKIQFISDLKESLVRKFSLPSNVQLLHNRFLLLEEDPVLLLRHDDLIEVVQTDEEAGSRREKSRKRKFEATQNLETSFSSPLICNNAEVTVSPSKKKKKHKHKDKIYDMGDCPKNQCSKSHDKNTKSDEIYSAYVKSFETSNIDNSKLDNSQVFECHKKKKKSFDSCLNNSQYMDITINDLKESEAHSSPYNYDLSLKRKSAGSELNNISSNSIHHVETNENIAVISNNSLKRKIKNEQTRLKYSGVAEVLKTIQSDSKTCEPDNVVDAQTEEPLFIPKTKRKRVRQRRKKNKLDESSNVSFSSQQSVDNSLKHGPNIESNPRLHKRFNSDENIDLNAGAQGIIDNLDGLTANLKLCNQISPLTPPSEHNSEDDVYKKLLDLRKMNKPAVFERKRIGDSNVIDDGESSHMNVNIAAEVAVSQTFGGVDSIFVPVSVDSFNAGCHEQISQVSSSIPRVLDDGDKEIFSSDAESKRNERDCPKKDTCPVHIKKNISDINLDKIDVNNYPIIESTRKNDVLVFKTLKLSASLTPTVSSLILARVLDVTEDNVILFEILSGKEEFDHLKDEENDSPDSLISLKWVDLFEPRLLYP